MFWDGLGIKPVVLSCSQASFFEDYIHEHTK